MATAAAADTYYVAPAGSDLNDGSQLQPWATLQHAADSAQAGDTVIVHGGAYAGMQITTSGAPGSPIEFRVAEGEVASIVADNPFTPDGINIEDADYVLIEGFVVNGRGRAGIRAALCEHVTIRGNLLHGNAANGIHMNGDASLGGDGVISQALVEDNVIFNNGTGGGSGINGDGVQDSLFRNNLIYDAHASGISLYRIDGGAPSTGNRVLNNTVVVAADGRWGINIRDASTGNTVKNNIVFSRHGYRGALSVCADCLSGLVSDHNVLESRFTLDDGESVLTLSGWQAATGQDGNSMAVSDLDALFVDSPAADFHLAPGPAVDAGEPLIEVTDDLEGNPRPLGPAWDAGCYEAGSFIFRDGFESMAASTYSGRTSTWRLIED